MKQLRFQDEPSGDERICLNATLQEPQSSKVIENAVETVPLNNRRGPLAWVLSDKSGLRQIVLQARGFITTSFHHDLHSKRHLESMLHSLRHQQPAVLWLRLAGPASGSGNRVDARRTENLVRLARVQIDSGRCLVIEANSKSGAWRMNAVMELCRTLHLSRHVWCRHERLQSSDSFPCRAELTLCTNFVMPSLNECRCPDGTKHVTSKSLSADVRMRSVLQSLVDIALREGRVVLGDTIIDNGPSHGQPESFNLSHNYRDNESSSSAMSSSRVSVGFRPTPNDSSLASGPQNMCTGEAFAKQALDQSDFSYDTCLQVLCGIDLSSQTQRRQVQKSKAGTKGCFVFGAYSYGAFYGVTRNLLKAPWAVKYVNLFLKSRGAVSPWSSFSINCNTVLAPQKDPNNVAESVNQSIALGPFQGGGLWVALTPSETEEVQAEVVPEAALAARVLGTGERILGRVLNSKHCLVSFSPKQYHATMPWTGTRWSITTYLNRGLVHLTAKHLHLLQSHGFLLPESFHQPAFMSAPACSNGTLPPYDASAADLVDPVQVMLPADQAFPTTQAVNRKAKLKAGHVVQPKLKIVEQWSDDMGEDLSSLASVIDCVAWTPFLLGSSAEAPPTSPVVHANEDFVYEYLCANESWLRGSGVLNLNQHVLQPSSFLAFVTSRSTWAAQLSVCELFGGEGRTSYLAAKLHDLTVGANFDLVCGFDLLNPEHVRLLWQYFATMRPLVVVMAPPCTAFCRLQGLNRVLHHAAWDRSHAIGLPLARLCAQVARFQLMQGRHFLLEQPHGSLLFELEEFQALIADFALVKVVFDQCMTGLRMMTFLFLPIRKRTQMWASAPIILARLSQYQCNNQHQHATISTVAGTNNAPHVSSRVSQVWPYKLCRILAAGIADLVCSISPTQYFVVHCPGCRGHLRMDDPKHTREGDCKYPGMTPSEWTCKACKLGRPRADKNHTLEPNCRWAIARTMLEGASRERRGHHPRDPRVPASRDPTVDLRLDDEPELVEPREPSSASGIRRVAEVAPGPFRRRDPKAPPAIRRNDASTQAEAAAEGPLNLAPIEPDGEAAEAPAVPLAVPAQPVAPAAAGAPEAAAEAGEDAAWNRFDLGHVLQQLRSVREGVVLRALRKLHIRWYHCSAAKMKDLLQAAGVSPDVLNLVSRVVDTCSICRAWSRPGPKSIATTHLPTKFNEVVEADLLFYKRHVILHLLDRCTRFTVASLLPNREVDSILELLHKHWIALLGPPATLVSDQEGAFQSPISATFLERKGVALKLRSKEQHAQTVERHHEILRQMLHKLEEQCTADGIRASFGMILSEAIFAKNALFRHGNASPYEAVFGRTPALLDALHFEAGADISERDCERLRHAAIQSMVQASAQDRLVRASASRTRPAGELLGIEVGDQVEFFRKPSTKDLSGWHGPATVVDTTSLRDGQLGLRWQGRLLTCRLQDIRALTYTCLLVTAESNSPTTIVQLAAEQHVGVIVRLGWFRSESRWLAFEANKRYARELLAGLHMASCLLHLSGVVSFRFGCDIASIPAVACDDSLLVWWPVGALEEWLHVFLPGHQSVNFQRLCPGLDRKIAFLQFFCESAESVASVRQVVDDVPNLGGLSIHKCRLLGM